MNAGKYRGHELAEVPTDYLEWVLEHSGLNKERWDAIMAEQARRTNAERVEAQTPVQQPWSGPCTCSTRSWRGCGWPAKATDGQGKEPLTDASHVKKVPARFDQDTDVSDEDGVVSFANVKAAAKHYKKAEAHEKPGALTAPGKSPDNSSRSSGSLGVTSVRRNSGTRRSRQRT